MMGKRGMSRGPGRPPLSNMGAMQRWILMDSDSDRNENGAVADDGDHDDDDGHDNNDDGDQDDGTRQPRWASPQCEGSA